ncbi:uncharacterized protein F4807DRAFT_408211 [Annulohypoxylon truncatum]|uniref:uncharacterized protein n=1 Tax=Annulohypoxylon truncatum TaxID=327061 RepID=UPI002008CE50|nr:uncharacterized protein F4807DRAFT_408211 [Annulohypoxylon truncatum]KAI1214464.1 hypothetical protein F4807DRAFT_408211 [Annulohypoxylon truncatum]
MTDTPIVIGTAPLPVEPPSLPYSTKDTEPSKKSTGLPPVTTGTSERYIHGLARARAAATLPHRALPRRETAARPIHRGPRPGRPPESHLRGFAHAPARQDSGRRVRGRGGELRGSGVLGAWEGGRDGCPDGDAGAEADL